MYCANFNGENGMSSIVSGYSYLVAVNFFGFL